MAEAQGREEVGEVGVAGQPPASPDIVEATLLHVVRALVDHVDDVRVDVTPDERGAVYRLSVHADDVGRVIGRNGRVARAIRQVVRAAAARAHMHVTVEIAG